MRICRYDRLPHRHRHRCGLGATRHALEYWYARAAVRVRLRPAPAVRSRPARGLNLTTAYNSGRTNGHGATGATATSLEF